MNVLKVIGIAGNVMIGVGTAGAGIAEFLRGEHGNAIANTLTTVCKKKAKGGK